jgi:hypothetical protein
MALRKLAAGAAMLALATPGLAFDAGDSGAATTMFYISIPLGLGSNAGLTRKEQQWSVGLQIQGKRDYPAARIDSTMLNAFSLNDVDAKWWLAGAVAVGAAAAISAKDKNTTSALQQQQTQQAQQQAASQQSGGTTSPGVCPRPVTDPCRK